MVSVKHFLCIVVCMTMQQSFCMEPSNKEAMIPTTALSKIKTWQDLRQFAGCIVAYTTILPQLGAGRGYSLCNKNAIKYAYVNINCIHSPSGHIGYSIDQLLKKEEVGNQDKIHNPPLNTILIYDKDISNVLTQSVIQKGSLRMGLATTQEINLISKAIYSNGAQFDQHNFDQDNNVAVNAMVFKFHCNYLNTLKQKYAEHMFQFLNAEPRKVTIYGREIKKKNYECTSPFLVLKHIARSIASFRYKLAIKD